ncbi:hypothetical protein EMPG_17593 [Blastomyces silverae]|uniref:Uncharacterized protein n=1 Tax=Blastomyces silverae TaxID=2060906 RepID=A0A0H1B6A1_9EURO|nr:hypothetical protein EMPG_17593 [Blastomyces silverae]
MAPGPVVGSKSKRPRKRANKNKKKRKKQPEAGEGDTEGKGEVKEVVGVGVAEQDSTTPVRLVSLDNNTTDATARRQSAWVKMRAEASQRELELEAKRGQELPKPFCCVHQSGGMFRMKGKTECGSCGNVTKRSFRCPDCEVVVCCKCVK